MSDTNRGERRRRLGRKAGRFLVLGVILVVAMTVALWQYTTLTLLLSYLIAVNVTTFLLYAYDKMIAGFQGLRVPERTLHVLQFVGGTPFALLAQEVLRHKTAKFRFRVVFWALAIVQIALIVAAWVYWGR